MTPIFASLYKVNEERREIYARAVQEIPDKAGELFDYFASKPAFQKWSAEAYSASGGASRGNIRAMHSNVAAGKVTEIHFNDAEKSVDVVCKIVDEDSWSKVLQGVYTGMSIGGSYGRKWRDEVGGNVVTRYSAVPSEISLVDSPCVPTARFFEIRKRNGTMIKRAFASKSMSTTEMANAVASGMALVGALSGGSINVIKGIHATGGRRMQPDFLHKYERSGALLKNQQVQAMRKALALPSESVNLAPEGGLAATGASNNWRDQIAPTAKPTRIGGQVIGTPSQSNMDAALTAIKQDLAREAKRIGV